MGLYLDIRSGPPERAVVLCVDEPSQIQALDRTRPGLPLGQGRAATSCRKHAFGMMTHDHKRHGTTPPFAALDVESGVVIGECLPRDRAGGGPRFLRRIAGPSSSRATCIRCPTVKRNGKQSGFEQR